MGAYLPAVDTERIVADCKRNNAKRLPFYLQSSTGASRMPTDQRQK